MTNRVAVNLVRRWLRDHGDVAYCSDCIARALKQRASVIRTVMAKLVVTQRAYWAERCECGKRGLKPGR